MTSPLRVALIGAGPAGIYAADILSKTGLEVSIDLYERLPAPFGLVRYGVAPDHPRIKQIILALQKILARGDVRLVGNVEVGKDVSLDELRRHYDAVIVSTGADRDAPLPVPGADLPGCYGAADFVAWYDGHPDVAREWPLEATSVAVLGVGNVALDVARMLTKHVEDLMPTEVPANVVEGLRANPVTDVHVFGRRGPAQAKFTPLELRELGKVPDVDVVVYPEDFEFDAGSQAAIRSTNQTKQVVKTLTDWTLREPEELTASRRIHLHFLHRPVEVLGTDRVTGIRTERTELAGDGTVRGTGQYVDTPVQAVYRAVGYFSSPLAGVAFDEVAGVIPNAEGRVLGEDGVIVPGLYATGWIKRGPVGLIGSTKSDAQQTVGHLVADVEEGTVAAGGAAGSPDALVAALEERGVLTTRWSGWELLDAYERSAGEAEGRERVKLVPRHEMARVSRAEESRG